MPLPGILGEVNTYQVLPVSRQGGGVAPGVEPHLSVGVVGEVGHHVLSVVQDEGLHGLTLLLGEGLRSGVYVRTHVRAPADG